MLYRTGISGLDLKFHFDVKRAMVCLDLEVPDTERLNYLWERLISLQTILKTEYLPEVTFDPEYLLETNKRIKRIYDQKEGVCIHDKNTWQEAMLFMSNRMSILEDFVVEYSEFIDP